MLGLTRFVSLRSLNDRGITLHSLNDRGREEKI